MYAIRSYYELWKAWLGLPISQAMPQYWVEAMNIETSSAPNWSRSAQSQSIPVRW